MARISTKKRKEQFLKAFEANDCIIAKACRDAKISRRQVFRWRQEDEKFREAFEDAGENYKDYLESDARKMSKKNPTMMIYLLKTKCRDRGYNENQLQPPVNDTLERLRKAYEEQRFK